jgi:UPF0755 protein
MQAARDKLLDELWSARSPAVQLKSIEEAVILASIVERETAKAEERPLIASVFLNRLAKGMRLQSDPTIIYGIVGGKGKLDRALTRNDIETLTPYNTYRIDGLPPGPISNPGRAALEAVLNPTPTDFLYFVADGSGGHAFAVTLEEHNRNVERWRQIAGSAVSALAEPPETESTKQTQSTEATQQTVTAPLPELVEPNAEDTATAPADVEAVTATTTTADADATAPEQAKTEEAATTEQTAPQSEVPPAAEEPMPKPLAKPQAKTTELEPGSVIEVKGQLVAIPKRNPKR